MNIKIERLAAKWKTSIIMIGGAPSSYDETTDSIDATFFHHEIRTRGHRIEIYDNLTDNVIYINRSDFYAIVIL